MRLETKGNSHYCKQHNCSDCWYTSCKIELSLKRISLLWCLSQGNSHQRIGGMNAWLSNEMTLSIKHNLVSWQDNLVHLLSAQR